MSTSLTDGFIVVDKMLEEWEIHFVGFGTVHPTHEDAAVALRKDIHPGFQDSYIIRELVNGSLVPLTA